MRTFSTWQVWMLQFILPRKFWYRKFYLRSGHWKSVRERKLKKAHHRCDKCISTFSKRVTDTTIHLTSLDVHHLNYKRLFRERMSDLQALCWSCHELEHKK